ncbi:alpha/beta fold hydrolase [Pseudoduganella sp.]|uniref:alpha/beta fold hydrolase n=1 Tax=Pseudoduganella sp. TaxID=1880898 RepID=UPI0035B07480
MRYLPHLLLLAAAAGLAGHHARAAPTVVLQAGLGDGQSAWHPILPGLAARGPVFAFDRPGYGGQAAVDGPRDPCTIAREQHALLERQGIAPPYLLVGHSLGGLYQYVFARLYPNEVAGMVLLDPTHPRHLATLQQEAPAMAALAKTVHTLTPNGTMRREFRDQAVCLETLDASQPIAAPVRLLTSGKGTVLPHLRSDWQRLTGAPKVETFEQSGHYLQRDVPDEVVRAIDSLR